MDAPGDPTAPEPMQAFDDGTEMPVSAAETATALLESLFDAHSTVPLRARILPASLFRAPTATPARTGLAAFSDGLPPNWYRALTPDGAPYFAKFVC